MANWRQGSFAGKIYTNRAAAKARTCAKYYRWRSAARADVRTGTFASKRRRDPAGFFRLIGPIPHQSNIGGTGRLRFDPETNGGST
jgi:hypothetical protein